RRLKRTRLKPSHKNYREGAGWTLWTVRHRWNDQRVVEWWLITGEYYARTSSRSVGRASRTRTGQKTRSTKVHLNKNAPRRGACLSTLDYKVESFCWMADDCGLFFRPAWSTVLAFGFWPAATSALAYARYVASSGVNCVAFAKA